MSDKKTSDFLEQLFTSISSDNNIPAELKVILLKLQLPLHKLSLDDVSFLSNEKHPARQTLVIARQLASLATNDHSVILKIHHIIDNLLQSEAGIQAYTIANQRLHSINTDTDDNENKANSKAADETIRSNLNQQIKLRLSGQTIPHDCKILTLKLWPTVLLKIAQTHGFKSRQLYNAFENYSELLDSIQPLEGIEQYKHLKDAYISIARKNNNLLLHFHKEHVVEKSIKSLISYYNKILGSSNYGQALKNIDQISVCDKLSSLPEEVKPGCWCELFIDEAKPKRKLKLSFIDIDHGKLIFVNRNGIKTLEKDAQEFTNELNNKQSRVITHQELFAALNKNNRSLRKTS